MFLLLCGALFLLRGYAPRPPVITEASPSGNTCKHRSVYDLYGIIGGYMYFQPLMQLVTPRVVAMAVKMETTSWIIVFQVSFFIFL